MKQAIFTFLLIVSLLAHRSLKGPWDRRSKGARGDKGITRCIEQLNPTLVALAQLTNDVASRNPNAMLTSLKALDDSVYTAVPKCKTLANNVFERTNNTHAKTCWRSFIRIGSISAVLKEYMASGTKQERMMQLMAALVNRSHTLVGTCTQAIMSIHEDHVINKSPECNQAALDVAKAARNLHLAFFKANAIPAVSEWSSKLMKKISQCFVPENMELHHQRTRNTNCFIGFADMKINVFRLLHDASEDTRDQTREDLSDLSKNVSYIRRRCSPHKEKNEEKIFYFMNCMVGLKKTVVGLTKACLLYTSPSPRDRQKSRMPSSA
eukprot:TRINITY_DN2099_c0_g1_i3.p1 TRINITY_DN2099_c0_g1~~TRINITY_DN2099_c0_g1_i3.p1  ORF type:complete len:323 (+),score=34.28 TRINITY_DN2099_c0_g1_i3:46-1014(+)